MNKPLMSHENMFLFTPTLGNDSVTSILTTPMNCQKTHTGAAQTGLESGPVSDVDSA